MQHRPTDKASKAVPRNFPLYLAILLALVILATVACGVKSGDRRGARPTQIAEFHRSPVTATEQVRIDLSKNDAGDCIADPANLSFTTSQRVRLAVQLQTEDIAQGSTGSAVVTGERESVTYSIPGLEITGAGVLFPPGATEVNLELLSGNRSSYDFNLANTGTFDIMCDGKKVGTFTVTDDQG